MEAPRWTSLDEAADTAVSVHAAAPAAVVAASARRAGGGWVRGVGAAGCLGEGLEDRPAGPSTIFDLASVTKPLTALAALRLAARGEVDLAAPVESFAPRFAGTTAGRRSLALLLRHRAGLAAHLPLFAPRLAGGAVDRARALEEAANAVRDGLPSPFPPEGAPVVYSDLGYLVAGVALEDRTGETLDALVAREVCDPLGLRLTSARRWRALDPTFDERVAPTERVPARGGVVRGVVHDENAWALADDGQCGHAGAFGVAQDVAALGEALVDVLAGDRPTFLPAASLREALAPWPGGSHVLGFDTRSGEAPSSGRAFGPRTFGHLGFTGTSLWIDPDAGMVGALLTNRVHPSREHVAIRAARPVVYDALATALRSERRDDG